MRAAALALFLTAPLVGGCGTSEGAARTSEVTEADRTGQRTALELLRNRYPSLRIDEVSGGLAISFRGRGVVVVVDGTRTPFVGQADDIQASEVVEIEVLTSMADTLIYGADAAASAVVRITTVLGGRDPRR